MEGHGRGGDGGEGVTMDPTKFGRKLTPWYSSPPLISGKV